MADSDILNFCNQYLISKVVLSDPNEIADLHQKTKYEKPSKNSKRSKFERPPKTKRVKI